MPINQTLYLMTRGYGVGDEHISLVPMIPNSTLKIDGNGNFYFESSLGLSTDFDLLPAAAAAAGSNSVLLSLGTSTEVIARSAKGGVDVKTQASTPAASDNAMLIPLTNGANIVPLTAASQPVFNTRLSIPVISTATGTTAGDTAADATMVTSAILVSAGFNETLTHVDPTTDAGDGADFLYAPGPGAAGAPVALTTPTGLAIATELNWICHQKVAGVDTFYNSGIAVNAAQDYDLKIAYGADLVPLFYINGNLVATGVAGTTGHSFGPVVGVQIMNSTPAGQLAIDVRYVNVTRLDG